MSIASTDETRTRDFPLPYGDAPVGVLEYDGHDILVWSIATTGEGNVIYLNCSAADAALSATLKRLLRKSSGKAIFKPAEDVRWPGPTELTRLTDHYDTVTQALTQKGLRLKNMCILPDCANIAAGLLRPMEELPARFVSSREGAEEECDASGSAECSDTEGSAADTNSSGVESSAADASSYRYILGDLCSDQPPPGALFAHLKSLVVVCHQEWEAILWEQGKKAGLLLSQPALGIRAWSMTCQRAQWCNLVGELWLSGLLPRPAPMMVTGTLARKR